MVDRPKGESDTLDALSEILELYLSQQLKNFENRFPIDSIQGKNPFFPALHKKNRNRPS